MARGPLHRNRYADRAPLPPDPVAVALRAARSGAVLAAVVALALLLLHYRAGVRFPVDPQFLVLLAFAAPVAVAWLRARRAVARAGRNGRRADRPDGKDGPTDPSGGPAAR